MVSAKASRIWNSHPGCPEQTIRIPNRGGTVFREGLTADEVLHAIEVTPKKCEFLQAQTGVTRHPLHPSTETGATEDDLITIPIDNFGARYSEVRGHGTKRLSRVQR